MGGLDGVHGQVDMGNVYRLHPVGGGRYLVAVSHEHFHYHPGQRLAHKEEHPIDETHYYVQGWPEDLAFHPNAERGGPDPCSPEFLERVLEASVARVEAERDEGLDQLAAEYEQGLIA